MDQWFDPVSLGIVLGGTLLATLLRCGPGELRLALGRALGLMSRPFDPAAAKADLAQQVARIAREGALRAEPVKVGDSDFGGLSQTLAGRRPLEALLAAHEAQKDRRTRAATTATQVFQNAAELAPVLGLAGTLIALGAIPVSGPATQSDTGMAGAVAMAVVTTLYGIAAANFLFGPLAAAIQRRSTREEQDRQAVVDWLEQTVGRECPDLRDRAPQPAAKSADIARFPAELRKAS